MKIYSKRGREQCQYMCDFFFQVRLFEIGSKSQEFFIFNVGVNDFHEKNTRSMMSHFENAAGGKMCYFEVTVEQMGIHFELSKTFEGNGFSSSVYNFQKMSNSESEYICTIQNILNYIL